MCTRDGFLTRNLMDLGFSIRKYPIYSNYCRKLKKFEGKFKAGLKNGNFKVSLRKNKQYEIEDYYQFKNDVKVKVILKTDLDGHEFQSNNKLGNSEKNDSLNEFFD